MKIEDIKVGDRVRLLPWVGGSAFSNAAVDREVSVETIESPHGTRAGLVFVRWLESIGWYWPAAAVEPVTPTRSSPYQRLARVQATVGRLVASASGPDRLLQLQGRMLRATKAAADLVVEEVAKMGES